MPTDYDKLREENIGRYGSETAHLAILGELYAERTHFIFELLQNSEDAKAKHVRFDLSAEGLDLLHDGRKFNDGRRQGGKQCMSEHKRRGLRAHRTIWDRLQVCLLLHGNARNSLG